MTNRKSQITNSFRIIGGAEDCNIQQKWGRFPREFVICHLLILDSTVRGMLHKKDASISGREFESGLEDSFLHFKIFQMILNYMEDKLAVIK